MQRHLRYVSLRPGLTLIELIVVLVILIGLAGIVIPMLPNMLTRTHTASAATNLQEINKLIETHDSMFFKFPDGWDSLTDGSTIPTWVPQVTAAPGPFLQVTTLSSVGAANATGTQLLAALNNAGIGNVYQFSSTTPQAPTFYPYAAVQTTTPPTATPITAATNLVFLTSPGIQQLALPGAGTGTPVYVVFGLGQYNSMIGKLAPDAPIHFSDDGTSGPQTAYCRFGAIFKLTDNNGTALSRASLVTAVDFSNDDGISGISGHVQGFYKAVNSSN